MAEVAGLALAVVPLLISAAEHYEDCLRPIERFIHFASRVDRFQQDLTVQKTIFRNQCRILLEDVVEHDIAERMLKDKKHPSWQDPQIEDGLVEQLEASKEACVTIISRVQSILEGLEEWSASLAKAIEDDSKNHRKGGKTWRSIIKAKVKLSFKEPKLDRNLSDLKELNDDFMRLSSQTSKLQNQKSASGFVSKSKPHGKDISKIKSIQAASSKVYEALSKSCSKHAEHRTHFCLEVKDTGSDQSPQYQFQVAFMRLAMQGVGVDPIFFVIESIVREADSQTSASETSALLIEGTNPVTAISTLKRATEAEGGIRKKIKQSVRFSCPAPAAPLSNYNAQNLKNLCMNRNFCDQLKVCLQQVSNSGGCYVGKLDDMDCYKHLVYFPKRTKTKRPPHSLQEILSTSQPLTRLSHFERLHIARSLATAVLQYHATPWLRTPLRCEDIFFFDDVGSQYQIETGYTKLSEPHIDVAVKHAEGALGCASEVAHSFAPNPVLYHLAVVLIELAFTASLNSLLSHSERSNRDRYTDFFAAKRLAGVVGREMGPKYGRIVEKCLGCHFAAGYDLNDKNLQTEYYKDVVQGLEELEKDFRVMNLC